MGAWGVDPMENDAALGWLADLMEADSPALLEETLDQILETTNDDLDDDSARVGLAACEILARLNADQLPVSHEEPDLDGWLADHGHLVTPDLLSKARDVVDLAQGPKSELTDAWRHSDYFQEWLDQLQELKDRLD